MVVRAAGNQFHAAFGECLGQRLRVHADGVLIGLEFGLHGFVQAYGLRGDDVHQRTALRAGEDALIDGLGILLFAEDHATARAAQGLVRGGGNDIGIGHGVHVLARGH